jgi:lipopolysaccharide transport system ATP-binding protein
MSTVIKVENLSKQYRLGLVGTGTFKEDSKKWWAKMTGKENPYAHEGEENDRITKGKSDFVWSLRDINFEVQQGDVLGVIGKNGAGKSTLLKILSKVTAPTTGSVKAKGRIASLLEVGTGFHPELTGRENVYLNGAILGMRKHEITRKLDEIIAFAGVERYIDTPVKRYSSGMYVRLAFAVAAHLENEILIIDEVLSVGDYEFQKKCLGKIHDVSKLSSRTVIFVSHNMPSVSSLCNKALYLDNGNSISYLDVNTAISKYLNLYQNSASLYYRNNQNVFSNAAGNIEINKVCLLDELGEFKDRFKTTESITIKIFWSNKLGVKCNPNIQIKNLHIDLTVLIANDSCIDLDGDKKSKIGDYESSFVIPSNYLNANNYLLSVAIDYHTPYLCYESHKDILVFSIFESFEEISPSRGYYKISREDSVLWPVLECSFNKIN